MALKEYLWRGTTWQIDDKDLARYPGAIPVVAPPKEKKRTPANKSRRTKNK